MRRVVVTGLGLVTPLGAEVETAWKNLIAGKSGAIFYRAFGDRLRQSEAMARVIADGRLGRKNKKGFYRYDERGKRAGVDANLYVKFDGASSEIPLLKPGAMVRKGAAGTAHEDGMTPALAAEVRAAGETICTDPQAVRWFYEGGTFT